MNYEIILTITLLIGALCYNVRAANINRDTTKSDDDQRVNNKNFVLERFNHHYPDGSYEFRYELADGQARYERGYFLAINQVKTLVVVGYYSYRMDDGRFITVFYNADQNGFRQNQSITPEVYPNLPRSIEVPAYNESEKETATFVPLKNTPKPGHNRRTGHENKI